MLILGFVIFIALAEIGLGLFVVSKKMRSLIHYTFLLLSLFMGIWSVCIGFVVSPFIFPKPIMLLLTNLMFLSGLPITSSFLMFSWVFPKYTKRINKWKIIWLSSQVVIVFYLLFFTNLFVIDVFPGRSLLDQIKFDIRGYFIYALFFISNAIWASVVLLKKYFNSQGIYRQQIAYFSIGLSSSVMLGAIFAVVLPILGNTMLVWLSPFFPIAFLSATAYSILKYRLLEIDVIIKRATLYLLLIAFITGIYAFILIVPQTIWTFSRPSSVLLMILSAAIIAVTLQPLRNWLDKISDRFFFQAQYNYFQLLERISRDLSTMVRLEDMLNMTSAALMNAMHLDKLGIYILGRTTGQLEFQCVKKIGDTSRELPQQISEDTPLTEYLSSSRTLLVTGEFLHYYGHLYKNGKIIDSTKAEIQNMLDNILNAGVIVPLWLKGHLAGFLVLGNKKSGDSYTDRDLSFLETIANQMAVVLENTRLYEQMLNNERLTVLGAMSASIAHEIRNPLAAIKTFVQMLPNKYQLTDFRMRFHEIVPSELDRLTRITEDLLIFARPSPPAFVSTEVNVILERVLTLMHNQLHKRGIEVATKFEPLPTIQADGQQLTQVFMNLILNAIQASKAHKTIHITTKFVQGNSETLFTGSAVFITIKDEGVGIAEKDVQNVFQPFFTTKHEGTGLGLPTSKRIVDAHHGEIYLESEVGIGTSFTVVLPLRQPTSESVAM